ncbi:MAG: hypothetical protein DHS20C21_16970 [Gemmatimonadota bacterium]|nr:MAG: hypothetical protein DHS20C21_16970 [Gemmatimonadota bacterium]
MSIARSYRLSRAGGAALALLAAIVMMWWAGRQGPPKREVTTGTIEQVFDSNLVGDTQRISKVLLSDGREARVTVPMYALRVGREIPLVIEVYRNGDEIVMFDAQRWMESAGS